MNVTGGSPGGKPGNKITQDTQDMQDGTRLVPSNESRDVKQDTTIPLFRSYQFIIVTTVMFLSGLLVPFQLFLRYRNVILKFTAFDWITFVAFLVLPFFVVIHQREHVVQILLVAFSGLAITSLLAYMYVPVLEFANQYQAIITVLGIETQEGVFLYNLATACSLTIAGSLTRLYQGWFQVNRKKESPGIQEQSLVLPVVVSLVLAAIIAFFIISIAGIAHSVFIIAALAATAGAMIVGSNFKSLVESWDPGARSSRIGWKNRRINLQVRNRLERRAIILPTMIITFVINLVIIAGTLFIFQITLAEDREPVYMHALLVNVVIGGLVTMAIKILAREVKIATMIAPAAACIALALLVAGSMNGDFSNPFVKYPLAGIAMVVPSLMLYVDGLKHERWGISGMLVVISWMAGGIISGIVAKPGDLVPIAPWLYLIIGILLVIALVMRFLRDIYLPHYKHPRGADSKRTGDVNGDSE